jgi:hypothetical protein
LVLWGSATGRAYFMAAQGERVIRGEPSDRLNFVQEGMRQTEMDYEALKELLKDEDLEVQ